MNDSSGITDEVTVELLTPDAHCTNIVEWITPEIEKCLEEHKMLGENPSWIAGPIMVPGPEGMMLSNILAISITSPIIGGDPITAATIFDLRSQLGKFDPIVATLLRQAREIRSQVLSQQPVEAPNDFDFSLLPKS